MKKIMTVLLGALLVLGLIPATQASAHVAQWVHVTKAGWVTVHDVVDGDTIHIVRPGYSYASNEKTSIRIIGINTPEIYGGVECGGEAAFAKLKAHVYPGQHVWVSWVPGKGEWDRYGRSLRYVSVHTAWPYHDVGADMIRTGLAKAAYDSGSYGTHPKRAWYRALDARYHYPRCPALRV